MDLKAKREKDLSVHKALYKTIYILTLIYPPHKDVKLVLKEDMFLKNNKKGFQLVAYYLLSIIDSEKLKQNVSGEPYDIRTENQFRIYIIKFINELNQNNPNANIPQIAMSHLISPSGLKFITFMLKLSQLALFEYLQTNPSTAARMLLPLKVSKVSPERLTNLQKVTSYIYGKCNDIEADFENNLAKCKIDAGAISNQQIINSKVFKENQSQLKMLEIRNAELFSNSLYTDLIENIKVKEMLEFLKLINTKIKDYNIALSLYLKSKSAELKYDKNISILQDKKSHDQNLDLINLFEKFVKVLDQRRLEIKPLGNEESIKQIERLQNLNQRLAVMNKDVMMSIQEYSKLCEDYEDGMVEFINGLQNDTESTPLAMRLPQSPISSPTIIC